MPVPAGIFAMNKSIANVHKFLDMKRQYSSSKAVLNFMISFAMYKYVEIVVNMQL